MKVCIVVPCYNESDRLDTSSFIDYAQRSQHYFLFVNDGSKDNTEHIIQEMAKRSEFITAISVDQNGGKAEAIRFGVNHLLKQSETYDLVGYYDSDQATPLCEIDHALSFLKLHPEYDMLMGMRLKRLGGRVFRDLKRHYLGRVFATFVSISLGLPSYDTQCGFKLIKSHLLKDLFLDPFTSPWFFDVELLFRIMMVRGREYASTKVYEFPLMEWEEVGGSKIGGSTYLKAPFQLLKIKRRYAKHIKP